MNKKICFLWKNGQLSGTATITEKSKACSEASPGTCFPFDGTGKSRLEIDFKNIQPPESSCPSIVTVYTQAFEFSFFLRDVSMEYPMLVPEYGVIVTEAEDMRDYKTIVEDIRKHGRVKLLRQWENNPENSFARAAERTKDIPADTALGISRDVRLFVLSFQCNDAARASQFESITPLFHGNSVSYKESNNVPVRYNFTLGKGIGCRHVMTRRLEDGCLPILHAELTEDCITYKVTAFAVLEKNPLNMIRGTHSEAASLLSAGYDATPQQREQAEQCLNQEKIEWAEEETVLYYRVKAVNHGAAPQYAWFTLPVPNGTAAPSNISNGVNTSYDTESGFQILSDTGRVFSMARLDGCPAPSEEMAVLIKPGHCATLEIKLPHSPISHDRAVVLADLDFEQKRQECHVFWQNELEKSVSVFLPETRIDEMVHAGFIHLNLVCYGKEPDGPISPSVGIPYNCIATESAPIILYFESLGRHDLARRCLEHFLNKQRPDGSIMTFGGYTIETGAALFLLCEHYRYTLDRAWAESVLGKLFCVYDYLVAWIERNKKAGTPGLGYGMLDGKTADPEDQFHSFMLNGYGYLGMKRFAELLEALGNERSGEVKQQSDEFKEHIREGLIKNMSRSPLVPLQDGSWSRSVSPWVEYRGPLCLFAEGGKCYTHAGIVARDSQLGVLYLVFCEVLAPEEPVVTQLLDMFCEHMFVENVCIGQPYYSRHPYIHLKRGERKAFLEAYYNTVAVMADRETYTFREDSYVSAVHKTHEEAWFLMETRWMLWLEDGDTLRLLSGVPSAWLENGKEIKVTNAASYFGALSFKVNSHLDEGHLEAEICCNSERKPARVSICLPHPEGMLRASRVEGGIYEPQYERVVIEPFSGSAKITAWF